MYIDSWYFILVLPALLFSLIAQLRVNSAFKRFSRVANERGLTGAAAARWILDANGLQDIRIERVPGSLSDHYDPTDNVIRLSDATYASDTVAAVGVAAHEAGHAIQHAEGYAPVRVRSAIIPITQIGSQISPLLILLGLLLSIGPLVQVGILLFSLVAVFQLVTLPVEYDASRRALAILQESTLLLPQEVDGAARVLRAAALTYVAALLTTLAQLLRLVLLFGGRRRD